MRIDVLLEPDQTPAQIAELAVLCEQQGIQRMWLQNYVACRDAFMTLVPAAMATRTVGLGVCVISPWEMHPVKMANALLTLQEYSNGRAGLVIGGGGEWLARLGIVPDRRVRAVREAVELVKGGTSKRVPTYQGEIYKAYGYRPAFGAADAPLVYVGANRSQMLRATVPAADGVMYSDMPRQRIHDVVQETRAARGAAGPLRISNIWAWHVKEDREVALREARRELLLRGLLEPWYLESFLSPDDCRIMEAHKPAFFKAYRDRSGVIPGVPEAVVAALIANLTFTGTPAEIEARLPELAAFRAAGVDELCLRLHDDPAEAIRYIGQRLVPALGGA